MHLAIVNMLDWMIGLFWVSIRRSVTVQAVDEVVVDILVFLAELAHRSYVDIILAVTERQSSYLGQWKTLLQVDVWRCLLNCKIFIATFAVFLLREVGVQMVDYWIHDTLPMNNKIFVVHQWYSYVVGLTNRLIKLVTARYERTIITLVGHIVHRLCCQFVHRFSTSG